MLKTTVPIWNYGDVNKIKIYKNGTINKNAIKCFQNGQCHSLALAINKLVGWPIYGFCDVYNGKTDPGHVVVKNPRNGGYVDINGYGALGRWRKKWGPITVHPLTPEQAKNLDTYLPFNIAKAMPFAKKVLERLGVKYEPS